MDRRGCPVPYVCVAHSNSQAIKTRLASSNCPRQMRYLPTASIKPMVTSGALPVSSAYAVAARACGKVAADGNQVAVSWLSNGNTAAAVRTAISAQRFSAFRPIVRGSVTPPDDAVKSQIRWIQSANNRATPRWHRPRRQEMSPCWPAVRAIPGHLRMKRRSIASGCRNPQNVIRPIAAGLASATCRIDSSQAMATTPAESLPRPPARPQAEQIAPMLSKRVKYAANEICERSIMAAACSRPPAASRRGPLADLPGIQLIILATRPHPQIGDRLSSIPGSKRHRPCHALPIGASAGNDDAPAPLHRKNASISSGLAALSKTSSQPSRLSSSRGLIR